jgi:hypothetical protein
MKRQLLAVSIYGMALLAPSLVLTAAPPSKEEATGVAAERARGELAVLKRLVADPRADLGDLWRAWQSFGLRFGGRPEIRESAALMRAAPSPLDRLDRREVPSEDRPTWLPAEVVAVLGEHRGRQ